MSLYVREAGPVDAPAMLFLHGLGLSSAMWQPQFECLADCYHCLAPDLPECGNSAAIGPFTLKEPASELVEEPDQRSQDMHMQRLLRNERIRLVIIGIGLLAIILSAVLFLFTGSIVALFVTIVVVPLFYRCVDVYLDKLDAYAR